MRNPKLEAELAALEVALPFLRRSLSTQMFESEVLFYRRDLLELAADDEETVEIDQRVRRALEQR